jgi:hypothetical protein
MNREFYTHLQNLPATSRLKQGICKQGRLRRNTRSSNDVIQNKY